MGMLMRYHYATQKPEIKAEEPKKVEIPVAEEKPVEKETKAVKRATRKPTTRKKK